MNKLLKKEITMKAISVLIAVILWFMVLDQSNPYETRTLNVPLNIVNTDALSNKNIILKNRNTFPQTVEVTLEGRHDMINNINESDFSASLDFAKITSVGAKSLRIETSYIGKDNSITNVKYPFSPQYVPLELDSNEKNTYPIDLETIGTPKEGYQIIDKTLNPDKLQLTGLDSVLKKVGSIKAVVDVTNLDRGITGKKLICTVYDKNEKIIQQLSENLTSEVKINVAKAVIVKPVVKGIPAPNFIDVSNIPSPEKLWITGPWEVISKIDQLITKPINIENLNQNTILNSLIILPDGVTLINDPQEITVSVGIEPLSQKTFNITNADMTLTNMDIDNSLNYSIVTPNVSIEIKGPKGELEKLDLSAISPSIDVNGLAEGNYKVPLKLTLPSTVKLIQNYEVELSIVKR